MIRRAMFLSMILLVVLAIIWVVVKPTRSERGPARSPGEVVQPSRPTLTRLLNPGDLVIEESNCDLMISGDPGAKRAGPRKPRRTVSARHRLVLHNNGTVVYRHIMLGFSYLNAAGKMLETRNYLVLDPVMPGESKSITGIGMEAVPAGSTKCAASILFADMERSK